MHISSVYNGTLIYGIIRTEIGESYVSALLAIGFRRELLVSGLGSGRSELHHRFFSLILREFWKLNSVSNETHTEFVKLGTEMDM